MIAQVQNTSNIFYLIKIWDTVKKIDWSISIVAILDCLNSKQKYGN